MLHSRSPPGVLLIVIMLLGRNDEFNAKTTQTTRASHHALHIAHHTCFASTADDNAFRRRLGNNTTGSSMLLPKNKGTFPPSCAQISVSSCRTTGISRQDQTEERYGALFFCFPLSLTHSVGESDSILTRARATTTTTVVLFTCALVRSTVLLYVRDKNPYCTTRNRCLLPRITCATRIWYNQ